MNHAQLRAAIAAWLKRSDLAASIPTFIELAEARISREFRLRNQITITTLTASSGSAALPSDFLEFKALVYADDATPIRVGSLEQVLADRARISGYRPKFCMVTGNSIQFGPSADIELTELPAGTLVHAVKVKHAEAVAGTGITAATLSLGVAGDLDRYSGGATVNVFDAPDATNYEVKLPDGGLPRGESHEAPWSLRAALTVTGANLSATTVGFVEIWLLLSVAASPDS